MAVAILAVVVIASSSEEEQVNHRINKRDAEDRTFFDEDFDLEFADYDPLDTLEELYEGGEEMITEGTNNILGRVIRSIFGGGKKRRPRGRRPHARRPILVPSQQV